MEKCLIVAVADNYAIGRRNQLLWNLPEDMKYFREQMKAGSPAADITLPAPQDILLHVS